MKRTFAFAAALGAVLAAATAAHAALDASMQVVGATQTFVGTNPIKGRTGTSVVTSVTDNLATATDLGHATGKRVHKPLLVTKLMDGASIDLRNALVTNETLKSVTIHFYRSGATTLTGGAGGAGAGDAKAYFTITLENAHVASIDFHQPSSRSTLPEVKNQESYEDVGFTYQKITWTWTEGGKTVSDTATP
jgi:type VI secretion system secreted protein Hcp